MAKNWYPAPAIVTLRDQINKKYPNRDKSTDGIIGDVAHSSRVSDHNPDWDAGGIVRAMDVDRDLYGADAANLNLNLKEMQALVDRLITDPRVKYLIYRSRIWQNPDVYTNGGWQPYINKPVGNPNPHIQHLHISVRSGAKYDGSREPWPVGAGSVTPTPTPAPTPTPTPVKEYPEIPLLEDGDLKVKTWKAFQLLMREVGFYHGLIDGDPGPMTITAMERWLKSLGYYKGLIEADYKKTPVFGPVLKMALQSFLYDKGLYRNGNYKKSVMVDGKFENRSAVGFQKYLNEQAEYLK